MADQPHHRRQDGLVPPARDTIAAIATATGRGGIGIVRVSGPATASIARALLGRLPSPRHATLAAFRNEEGRVLDDGLALFFPRPRSFTGEDVLELHGHGGPVVLDMVLSRVLALGARVARPGEFSERAFLNGKLDLLQAEAVADLIDAGSRAAAQAALRSLHGEFSEQVHRLRDVLIALRTHIEAAIDFPEDEIDFLSDPRIAARLTDARQQLADLRAAAAQGRCLHDGLSVVIAGRPNAGKSSVLNRLARADAAIVSATPGTTRDLLREQLDIDGLPVHVVDTAGLREATDDIEREGVRRAQAALEQADLALLVVDDTTEDEAGIEQLRSMLPSALPVTVIYNKIDLSGRAAGPVAGSEPPAIALSAKTDAGLSGLRQHLKTMAGYRSNADGTFSARRRHLDALARTDAYVTAAAGALRENRGGEIVAEELRLAQQALGEITGEFLADDLLGRIFASFCIGK